VAIGRIFVEDRDRGIGFTLATRLGRTSRIALTANHVIRGQETSSLQFVTEDRREVEVERVEPDEIGNLNVAVLHLREEVSEALEVGPAVEAANWKVEAPTGHDPDLGGTITSVRRRYLNDKGLETYVVQLRVSDWVVGGYKGYSGSPVVQSPYNTVIGVLIEQQYLRLRRPVAAVAAVNKNC
jgi:hypothetical protein